MKTNKTNKTNKDSPTLVFFDFNKAYDSVPRDKLTHKLITIGTPCNIVKLINNMLKNFTLSISNETIRTHKGLIQGSVLSPILFNIFINYLMIIFQTNKIETRAYADDIICIWSNLSQVKQAILIMKQWCIQNEMKINENKSGILRILKMKRKTGLIENCLNIPEVDTYKYLGIQINQSLRSETHNKFIKQKVSAIIRRVHLLKPSLIDLKK